MRNFYKFFILFFFICIDGCREELRDDQIYRGEVFESNNNELSLFHDDLVSDNEEIKYDKISSNFFELLPVQNFNTYSHFSYQKIFFLFKILRYSEFLIVIRYSDTNKDFERKYIDIPIKFKFKNLNVRENILLELIDTSVIDKQVFTLEDTDAVNIFESLIPSNILKNNSILWEKNDKSFIVNNACSFFLLAKASRDLNGFIKKILCNDLKSLIIILNQNRSFEIKY